MGARYLMFLAPTFRLSNGEYFSGVGHPWRFVISRNGCVYVEDIFAEKLVRYFPPQPLESVLKELEKPYDPSSSQGGLPYPPPAPSNFCSPKPLPGPYPYPAP